MENIKILPEEEVLQNLRFTKVKLEKKIGDIESNLERVNLAIAAYESIVEPAISIPAATNGNGSTKSVTAMTWKERIEYALTRLGGSAKVKAMGDLLVPMLLPDIDEETTRRRLTVVASDLAGEGKLSGVAPEIGRAFTYSLIPKEQPKVAALL